MSLCACCFTRHESAICPNCGYNENDAPIESIHLPIGSLLKDRYRIGGVLGSGSFGATYAAYDTERDEKVALKEYLPAEFAARVPGKAELTLFKDSKKQKQFHDGLVKFLEEADKLRQLPPESGVVQIYNSFAENNTAYIVMEFLHGFTLADWFRSNPVVPASAAINMMMPVISSLKFIHASGIIHGDISPENIFLTQDGRAKLIDFGASRYATTSHSRSLTVVIKAGYSPEELYRSKGDQGPFTDIYSLGAVLYRMITGAPPPDALERRAFFERSKKDILKPIRAHGITKNQTTAILNALNIRIEDRTADASVFEEELCTNRPVKRRRNGIKRTIIDLSWKAKTAILLSVSSIAAVFALLATGVISFGTGLGDGIVVPDGMTRVPSVVNENYDNAAELLAQAELLLSIAGKEYSNNIPVNYILSQDLAAGMLTETNTIVNLTISGGPELKLVPMVSGEAEETARNILESLGFSVKREAKFSQVIPSGFVISTSVEPNSDFAVGETIMLYVSKGPSENLGAFISEVPNLIGLDWQAASDAAENAAFTISIKNQEYNNSVPLNHIISQSLTPGTREMNDLVIELVVSLGEHLLRVPDLQYKSEDAARAALSQDNLSISVSYENSETVAKGLVISQNPSPGSSVKDGSTVSLLISSGVPSFSVPNVVNMSEKDARSSLSSKGLSITVAYENSNTVAEGIVLSQSLISGSNASRGDRITITVSSGKKLVSIPSVVGLDKASAKSTLENAGFKVSENEVYSDYISKGNVISQSPSAGSQQIENSSVIITVSLGREPIKVPNLVSLSQSYAERMLSDLGLNSNSTGEYSDSVPIGLVISHSPASNSSLNKGDTVFLIVSLGPEKDELADVIGLNQSSAESILRKQNLTIIIESEFNSRVPKGSVISQSPLPGTLIKAGDPVVLVLSLGKMQVSVPNLLNQSEQSAISLISSLGLGINLQYSSSETVDAGKVISQFPVSGTMLDVDSVVTIVISNGRDRVPVPNVINDSEANAVSLIQAQRLLVTIVTASHPSVPAGRVISQSPSAGTMLEPDSIVIITVSTGVESPPVASVVGSPQAAAELALRNQGFIVNVISQSSNSVAEGLVISQSPAAGTPLQAGSTVTITVSSGAEKPQVPSLVGASQDNAKAALLDLGLSFIIDSQSSDSIAEGLVISQYPAAGTIVEPGSSVTLTVSSGKEKPKVPSLTGFSQDYAKAALLDLGLSVIIDSQSSDSVAEGLVISQSPAAGTSVEPGSSVTITVSSGKENPRLPNLVGKTQLDAELALLDLGLSVIIDSQSSDSITKGLVISQYPAAGTSVEPGSSVTITISSGKENPKVPSLVGFTREYAETALSELGLSLVVLMQSSDSVDEGYVISQSPVAGTSVEPASSVTITVSSGSDKVIVPYLLNLHKDDALELLYALSLNVTFVEEYSDFVEKDFVISQSPTDGASVDEGSLITLTISSGKEKLSLESVVGLSAANAKSRLESLGFKVLISYAAHPSIKKDTVISQSPAASSSLNKGSTVTISVSSGSSIAIADVTGKSLADAESILKAQGLRVDIVYDSSVSVDAGKVISQSDSPGTIVNYDALITLTISNGSP